MQTSTIILLLAVAVTSAWFLWRIMRDTYHAFNIAELIPDALLVIDEAGNIISANNNAVSLFGYSKDELYAMAVEDLMPERYRKKHIHQRTNFHNTPEVRSMGTGRDLFILKKDGTEIPAEIALSPASSHSFLQKKNHKTVVLLHDISERKSNEKRIHDLAYKDILTSLPNRQSFYSHSQSILDDAIAKKHNLAFILVDIRGLKQINDTLGHFVGDDVIQRTGVILEHFLKEHECECDKKTHLFKISGNEFLFLLSHDPTVIGCVDVAAKDLIKTFKKPTKIEGSAIDIHININMGISMLPSHGISASQLLKTADIALIKAKQQGQNTFCYYNKTMHSEFNNFVIYENAIKYFIKTKDFDIAFQPVWDITDHKYVGAEVLFRCNERRYREMKVDFLISVAESTGQIIPLGNAIIERACEEIERYGLLHGDLVISINASIQQLEDPNFTNIVCAAIEKTNIKPKHLAIEITETTLMNQEAQVVGKVKELQSHGVRIYIDDFGKGFSSLAYLNTIPADKLKVDISFLAGIETDMNNSVAILRGIVELGHALKMVVCTEGVETEQQMNILKALGCDEIQGYYKGKPTAAHKLKEEYKDMYKNCDE